MSARLAYGEQYPQDSCVFLPVTRLYEGPEGVDHFVDPHVVSRLGSFVVFCRPHVALTDTWVFTAVTFEVIQRVVRLRIVELCAIERKTSDFVVFNVLVCTG